jgi:hypothetical protein
MHNELRTRVEILDGVLPNERRVVAFVLDYVSQLFYHVSRLASLCGL